MTDDGARPSSAPDEDLLRELAVRTWQTARPRAPSGIRVMTSSLGQPEREFLAPAAGAAACLATSIGLPAPELSVAADPNLRDGEFEIAVEGVVRYAGSFDSTWIRSWSGHPAFGSNGRSGAARASGPATAAMPPAAQAARAVEAVLWDDPGLLLRGDGLERFQRSLPDAPWLAASVLSELASRHLSVSRASAEIARDVSLDVNVERTAQHVREYAVSVKLGGHAGSAPGEAVDAGSLAEWLESARNGLAAEVGITFPEAAVELTDELPPHDYQVVVNGLPRASGTIPPGCAVSPWPGPPGDPPDAGPCVDPVAGILLRWVDEDDPTSKWSATAWLTRQVEACLRDASREFVDMSLIDQLLGDLADAGYRRLVTAARGPVSLSSELLAWTLGLFVSEGLALRPLPRIIDRLVEVRSSTALHAPRGDPDGGVSATGAELLVDELRRGMPDAVTFHASGGRSSLSVILLSPDIEDAIRAAAGGSAARSSVYDFPDAGRLLRAVRTRLTPDPGAESAASPDAAAAPALQPVALVVTEEIRAHVHRLLAAQFPWVHVLSAGELDPAVADTASVETLNV
jgi:flagellar biosynthesis component FlhA